MPFKKGYDPKRANGGAREGAGRPADWLRAECQKHAPKLIEFLASVADGQDVEQAVGAEGEVIRVPAAVRDRVRATEILLDRGYGKPNQSVEVSGDATSELAVLPASSLIQIVEALKGGKA